MGSEMYLIASGKVRISKMVPGVGEEALAILDPGSYFGEIALLDQGVRSATITADSELVCRGITLWDFRPLVQSNAAIAWTLLQTLARTVREANEAGLPPHA